MINSKIATLHVIVSDIDTEILAIHWYSQGAILLVVSCAPIGECCLKSWHSAAGVKSVTSAMMWEVGA